MFVRTSIHRVRTLSEVLAHLVLYTAHFAGVTTPFSTLVLGGAVYRALSMPLTIYGDQCLSRIAGALPELHEAHRQYVSIIDHPRAIVWEKKVATRKLQADRARIFRSHSTNNVKMVVPHVVALLLVLYGMCIPAQQLYMMLVKGLGAPIVSPFALAVDADGSIHMAAAATASALSTGSGASFVCLVDPTLSIAVTLTFFNILQHLKRREGFNDRLDGWIRQGRRYLWMAYAAITLCHLGIGPLLAMASGAGYLTSIGSVLPVWLAPVWLGVGSITATKTLLINGTAPGRAVFKIADYPPQHGTYGCTGTAEAHEYRLAFTGIDREEHQDMWLSQKKALDYECDVRLHRMLTKMGIFDTVEELEYEADKLRHRREIARERRLRNRTSAGRDSITDTGIPSCPTESPTIRCTDETAHHSRGGEINAQTYAQLHYDDIQKEANERQRQRRERKASQHTARW